MGAKLKDAQRKLAEVISSHRALALGRNTKHGELENLPSDIFRIPRIELVVSPHGDLQTLAPHRGLYEGRQWQEIEFEAAAIRLAFPNSAHPAAEEWMLLEAERYWAKGIMGKREIMINECRKITACTKRQAEAAHRKLPTQYRRPIGKPPKYTG
jgi:hypothetical protein